MSHRVVVPFGSWCLVYTLYLTFLSSGLDSPLSNSFNRTLPGTSLNSSPRYRLYSPDYKSWWSRLLSLSSLKWKHPRPLKCRECASVPQDECCGEVTAKSQYLCFEMLVQMHKWNHFYRGRSVKRRCKIIIGLFSSFLVCLLMCVEVNINYMCVHNSTYPVCIFVVCHENSFLYKTTSLTDTQWGAHLKTFSLCS